MTRPSTRRSVLLALVALAVLTIAIVRLSDPEDAPDLPDGRPTTDRDPASRGDANEPPGRPRAARPGAADATPSVVAAPAPARRVLRVVDRAGNPVPWLVVLGRQSAESDTAVVRGSTDARGEWEVDSHLGDEAVALLPDGAGTRTVPLGGGESVVILEGLPEVVVDVVDGLTGREVAAGSVRLGIAKDDDSREVAARLTLDRDGLRFRLPVVPRSLSASVEVEPPPGFVQGAAVHLSTQCAATTRTLRVVAPVYPEARLTVRLVEERGEGDEVVPLLGAVLKRVDPVGSVRLARQGSGPSLEPTGEPGTYRVRGLPAMPHLLVDFVVVEVPGRADAADEESRSMRRFGAWIGVPVVADAIVERRVWEIPPESPFEGPGTTGTIGYGGGRSRDSTVPLRVRFLDVSGRPVRDGDVALVDSDSETTDADGWVTLDVRRGARAVVATKHGVLPVARRFEVNEPMEIVLHEPVGRPIEVRVVDEAGRPAPFATVQARIVKLPPSDGRGEPLGMKLDLPLIAGAEEWPVPLADAGGRLVFPRAPESSVEFTAALGSASGRSTSDGTSVTVVIEPPKERDR